MLDLILYNLKIPKTHTNTGSSHCGGNVIFV